jgi:cell shape-determining protein MreC
MLEGTGRRLCRIRLVVTTEPVSDGDLVFTTTHQGLLPEPLLYGRVTRVERLAGSAHWQIWMQPAAAPELPETVSVLRARLNPNQRVASDVP